MYYARIKEIHCNAIILLTFEKWNIQLQIPHTAAGINITNSNISKIETDAFSNFTNSLVQLHITRCGVEEIEPDAFRGLDKLEVLGLVGNKIRNVDAKWTRGLSKLKNLDLSGNGNVSIDCQAAYLMPKIAGNVHISCKPGFWLNRLKFGRWDFIQRQAFRTNPGMQTQCCDSPYQYWG